MPSPNLSHSALVRIAARWLSGTWKCGAVLTEVGARTPHGEMPDAIGFRKNTSVLIECKVTRADFLADQKKPFRVKPNLGMGQFRFYLAPAGLLKKEDVKDTGWGLLETVGKRVKVVEHALPFQKRSLRAELRLMYTALQRVQFRIKYPLYEVVSWDAKNEVFDVILPEEELTEKMDYV